MKSFSLLLLVMSSNAFIPHSKNINRICCSWVYIKKSEIREAQTENSTPPSLTSVPPQSSFKVDKILTLLTSDVSSILLGSTGFLLASFNRFSSIDYESDYIAFNEAAGMGVQSRIDLLAVFSAGAVLFNGLSNLDVKSVMAESVVLDGKTLGEVIYRNEVVQDICREIEVEWAFKSLKMCSPARTIILLVYSARKWNILALDGIVPNEKKLCTDIPDEVPTPILNRFLKDGQDKGESYLPTLQALPGRSEFSYLPKNTQEILLLPIQQLESHDEKGILVLGSGTAKSFSPRDIAWCQIVANRLGFQSG